MQPPKGRHLGQRRRVRQSMNGPESDRGDGDPVEEPPPVVVGETPCHVSRQGERPGVRPPKGARRRETEPRDPADQGRAEGPEHQHAQKDGAEHCEGRAVAAAGDGGGHRDVGHEQHDTCDRQPLMPAHHLVETPEPALQLAAEAHQDQAKGHQRDTPAPQRLPQEHHGIGLPDGVAQPGRHRPCHADPQERRPYVFGPQRAGPRDDVSELRWVPNHHGPRHRWTPLRNALILLYICSDSLGRGGAMGATADGRRARGELSRAAILEAALTVVADSGLPALTHRSVAVEAGVSPALVTYHFASSEHLRQQTLTFAADRVGATLEDLLDATPTARDVPQVAAELARRLRRGDATRVPRPVRTDGDRDARSVAAPRRPALHRPPGRPDPTTLRGSRARPRRLQRFPRHDSSRTSRPEPTSPHSACASHA